MKLVHRNKKRCETQIKENIYIMCCYKIPLGGCFDNSSEYLFMYFSFSTDSTMERIALFSNWIRAPIIILPEYNEMTIPLGEFKMSTK